MQWKESVTTISQLFHQEFPVYSKAKLSIRENRLPNKKKQVALTIQICLFHIHLSNAKSGRIWVQENEVWSIMKERQHPGKKIFLMRFVRCYYSLCHLS
jgi:hypothetical protein